MGCMPFGMDVDAEHNDCEVASEHKRSDKVAELVHMSCEACYKLVHKTVCTAKHKVPMHKAMKHMVTHKAMKHMSKHMALEHMLGMGNQLSGKGCKRVEHMKKVYHMLGQLLSERTLLVELALQRLALIQPKERLQSVRLR